ncbi:MAG TPA: hopanoid biosynthesis-associated protein HpnK [Stellaceae bacterium]|nr:hopanoid biosynthesis-associated protein HpnK [Stellaceae bacterium]
MPKRLIVTADDFGLDEAVNDAVERAHRHGILTCASLMVGEPAAADAVARTRAMPRLGVGLHLTFVDGRPTLPPERIPALVAPDGRFPSDPVRQGLRIFFSPAARRQLAAEMRAQLDAFRRTGLALDHVNGHHHFHIHPVIRGLILRWAPEYAIRAVRVPASRRPPPARSLEAWSNDWQSGRLRRRLARAGIAANDDIFGLAESGHMTIAPIRDAVARIGDGVSEIYCHPVARAWRPGDPWPEDYDGLGEMQALLDPELPPRLAERGIELATFATARSR